MPSPDFLTANKDWRLGIRSGKQTVILCILLFGLVIWTFFPSVHNDFVNYDDPVYVSTNEQVQSGLSWESVRWAFQDTQATGNWHPVTWLSHMLDWQLYGARPLGHHLTSVVLHAVNAVLLFLVLGRMTGAVWRSLFVAAVFALHPLRVESVAWVAERKDVLSTLFWLLTLWAYVRYVEESKVLSPKSKVLYGLTLLAFALGLMSKPMVVTLPFALLLLDHWPLNRWRNEGAGRLVAEKAPFFVLAVIMCVVTYSVQKQTGAMVPLAGRSFGGRLESAVVSYGRYLGKLFWPENLSVLYPAPHGWPILIVLVSLGLLLSVTVLAVTTLRRAPYVFTGWFWFVGTLVPVIGLVAVGGQAIADRYTYVPSIGILILLAWGMHDLTKDWRFGRVAASVVSTLAIGLCMTLTRQQIGYWRNSEALFRHALATTQENYYAHSNLGLALLAQGRVDEALDEFREAVRIAPRASDAHDNLGVTLAIKNRLDEAVDEFQESLNLSPRDGETQFNLAKALERKGDVFGAIQNYRRAVELKPDCIEGYKCLGRLLADKGLLDEAINQLQRVVALTPSDSSAHNNLGIVLSRKGRVDEAIAEFQEAVRLDPTNASAKQNLGILQELKRR